MITRAISYAAARRLFAIYFQEIFSLFQDADMTYAFTRHVIHYARQGHIERRQKLTYIDFHAGLATFSAACAIFK